MNQTSKQAELNALYEPYKNGRTCPLCHLGRTNVVFGHGNAAAKLMIIGEAPGKEEDLLGQPFVGRSGKLLTKVLNLLGIDRKDIFITNIVKCRPPANRRPTPAEVKECRKLLLKEIEVIKPAVICTLGATAFSGLLERPIKITQEHGKPIKFNSAWLVPIYHPAYILRNPKEVAIFTKDIQTALGLIK